MTSPNTAEPTAWPEPSQTPSSQPAAAAGTGNRLAWLDVLRGLAALAVVFNHFGYFVPAALKNPVNQWVDSGAYGVFVFFIISGYIVPASLERKGSVRTFWVSRIFRLYPLYLLAVAIALALFGAGLALRRVAWPRALTWLGLISYSVYLLHPALIQVYRHMSWTAHHSFWIQMLIDALFVAILIAVCSVTYLLVERPMQDVGRRLARVLDARFGPDRFPARTRAPEPALAHGTGRAE
jgi:peptidoglycan/LPS O-acetylase OafA/YrhL